MALDPRISLAIRVPDASSALDAFENTRQKIQDREIQKQQADQQSTLHKQQIAQGEQQAKQDQIAADQARQQRILKSVNDFAIGNQSLINEAQTTGDFTRLRGALEQRKSQLQQQGLPTETTNDGIAMIDAGQGGQVISSLGDAVNLYNQQTGLQQKSVAQRDYDSKLAVIKADPQFTTLEGQAAAIDLGLLGRAPSASAKTVDIGGVPHVFDPIKQTMTPVKIEGQEVTTDTVAQSEAKILEESEKVKTKETGRRGAIAAATAFAKDSNNKISGIQDLTENYTLAIEQLDAGAETGIVYSMLPSFDTNAMILDNISSQAGFNLAKSGGGIITEADMAWGMKTAIPQNLPPAELKDFLQKRSAAQTKIIKHLQEVTEFLGDGDKTLPDWYRHQRSTGKIKGLSDEELFK